MTHASLEAYKEPENKKRRLTEKEILLELLTLNKYKKYTYPQSSKQTGIPVNNCQKRLSDLHKEGKVKITGSLDGYSCYQYRTPKTGALTVSEAYKQAISKFCPIFQPQINDEVNKLVKR